MSKPFSELSRSLTDTLAYRFSQTSFEARILLSQIFIYAQKNLKGFFVSRCLIFKVRCPLFKVFCVPLLRFVFAPLEECLDIIALQVPFVKHFFQIFLKFFQLFYQSQYLVVVHIQQPQLLRLGPLKNFEYFAPK